MWKLSLKMPRVWWHMTPDKMFSAIRVYKLSFLFLLLEYHFFKILLGFYCCCLIPILTKNLPIPLAVGTNHYTLLPAREVFDFLLQSSASRREQNSSFAFCPWDVALHCLYTKPIYSKILIKDTKLTNQPHVKGSQDIIFL